MKRLIATGLAIAGISMALVTGGSPVSAGVDGEAFRGEDVPINLRWRSCFAEFGPGFECATARVPLDYDRLNGGKIPVDLVRLPASGDKVGSLFLNPGGPGGSGIDFVLDAGPILYTPEVRAAYDLIGFDPRGIGRSNPLLCFGGLDAAFQSFPPFPFPTNADEVKVQRAANNYLQTQCRNNGSIIKDKMSSANVARDLEVLRAAVGDEYLNFAGYSYGSVIGQVYANLFPDRVGHVIIDGVIDIESWVGDTGPLARDTTTINERLRSDIGAEDTLGEFFRQCDAIGPGVCPIGPDAEARTMAILAGLEINPIPFIDPFTGEELFLITRAELTGLLLGTMYSTNAWTFLGFELATLEAAQAGPGDTNGAAAMQVVDRLRELQPIRRPNPPYPNIAEGFPGVACVDTSNPVNLREWVEAADELVQESPVYGEIWTWGESMCARWPGKDRDRFVGPFRQETVNPVLVLSTRFDAATRYEEAVSAHDKLPGSSLVTVEGASHTTLFTSTCVDALTAAYLLDDVLPADDTICAQDLSVPFAPPPPPDQAFARSALLREALGTGFGG